MTEVVQRLVVAVAIGAAVAYLGWRGWRKLAAARRRTNGDCGSDCACGKH